MPNALLPVNYRALRSTLYCQCNAYHQGRKQHQQKQRYQHIETALDGKLKIAHGVGRNGNERLLTEVLNRSARRKSNLHFQRIEFTDGAIQLLL